MSSGYKAYLIDPENRSVTEVVVKDYKCINRHIGSEIFCIGSHLPDGDAVFVDDEGLLHEGSTQHFFQLDGRKIESSNSQMLAGKAVVVGSNVAGDTQDVQADMEELFGAIKWFGAGSCHCDAHGIVIVMHDGAAGEDQL